MMIVRKLARKQGLDKQQAAGLRLLCILLCTVLCGALTGCGKGESGAQQDKLVIYTSVYPVYDFTCKLAGDCATVVNLVPAGVEPHEFELGTQDMARLEDSDMLVYCGAGMESWIDKTLQTLGSDRLTAVEASEGISLLSTEETEDPHVWLNPQNALIMLENIKDALCRADSVNEAVYSANFEDCKKKLEALHQSYQEALSSVFGREIIVSHASFGYLCDAYGLTQTAVEGLMADSEPDPATMGEIIRHMKENGITTIFDEELIDNKVVDAIAAETGASVEILDPIEGLSEQRMEAGEDYFSVMEKNLATLKAALK